jgi:hypothetical protein
MNVVVMVAATTRRLILSKGIFKRRRSIAGRFVSPK